MLTWLQFNCKMVFIFYFFIFIVLDIIEVPLRKCSGKFESEFIYKVECGLEMFAIVFSIIILQILAIFTVSYLYIM